MGKYSQEHWEMVKWLQNHEISLGEKYDLENAPRYGKKRKKPRQPSREPEDTLDLHGMTVEESSMRIKSFILTSKLKGLYLVKIIHGKGLHSPGESKLKALVVEYLNSEVKKMISAWEHAPPNQGGEGAVLVYL